MSTEDSMANSIDGTLRVSKEYSMLMVIAVYPRDTQVDY